MRGSVLSSPIQAVCAHCGSDWPEQAGADFLILLDEITTDCPKKVAQYERSMRRSVPGLTEGPVTPALHGNDQAPNSGQLYFSAGRWNRG